MYAVVDEGTRWRCLKLAREQLPTDRTRRHLKLQISRIVHQLKDSVWCVVTLAVAEFVNARVSAWAICVAFCQCGEHFGSELRLQEESGCASVRLEVTLLGHGYDL